MTKQRGDRNLTCNFGCTHTSISRSGIDLSHYPDVAMKLDDKEIEVEEREGLRGAAQQLWKKAKQWSAHDLFAKGMGSA